MHFLKVNFQIAGFTICERPVLFLLKKEKIKKTVSKA